MGNKLFFGDRLGGDHGNDIRTGMGLNPNLREIPGEFSILGIHAALRY